MADASQHFKLIEEVHACLSAWDVSMNNRGPRMNPWKINLKPRNAFIANTTVLQVTYFLLTEFEGCIVSHGTSLFPIDLWPKRKARERQIEGEKRGFAIYSTAREYEVIKIFIISLLCAGRFLETISIHAEQLQISDPLRKQNGSIWNRCKWL